MDKYDQLKYVGSMQQLAYIRPLVWQEGRTCGMRGYDIQNGMLHFQVMTDKCLDIANLSYKGVNFSFLAKPGLTGRMDYDTHGDEGRKSLMGGMMFTCGLDNTCLPCTEDVSYLMHGRIRSTPAEQAGARAEWGKDAYLLSVQGEMREAEIFGKNLVLKRKIETVFGEKSIIISDTIVNDSYRDETMMLLYHINAGYPFLDENAEVILPTKSIVPRDAAAMKNKEQWMKMEPPVDNEPERVYLHDLDADKAGDTFAAIINHKLKLGLLIEFNKRYLPKFVQWKSIASGDYVMGLEPTNSGVYGRVAEGEDRHIIASRSEENIILKMTILDGDDEFQKVMERFGNIEVCNEIC